MFGFRLLAIILGIICLASTCALIFHDCGCPIMNKVNDFVIQEFVPDHGVRTFIKSPGMVEMKVKHMVKYIFSGYAILALGLGLLFLYSAVNPLRMRPFVVVVMIGSIFWLAGAIWKGMSLEMPKVWWISDAAGALILLVLLFALFPREKAPGGTAGAVELEDEQEE